MLKKCFKMHAAHNNVLNADCLRNEYSIDCWESQKKCNKLGEKVLEKNEEEHMWNH